MIFILSTVLLVAQNASAGAPPPLPTGQIVDSVVCLHDSKQSYALFLPASYRSDRQWPILYAFDPMARGRVPVALFSEAAARFGYIVVGSNNSRNGPVEPMYEAIEAVWRDTHARFKIDTKRVYATGMSGGTFPALTLCAHRGAAIVACAGAMNVDRMSQNAPQFDWLGVAGKADFNYTRNKALVQAFAKDGVVARFETFEGGHGWPPEDVAERAVEWLELSAMRNGTRSVDVAFIDSYQERGVLRARDAVENGRVDDAAEEYAALARELRGFKSVDNLESEARRLRETRGAKKDRKREAKLDEKDREQTQRLFMLLRVLQRPETPAMRANPALPRADSSAASDDPFAIGSQSVFPAENAAASARRELRDRIRRLRHDLESKKAERRLVARRVFDGFRIGAYYDGKEQYSKGDMHAAKIAFEYCVEASPENAYFRYELARAHAALRDKKKALAELRQAVEDGFSDSERLANDEEWELLRNEPDYLGIVSKLLNRE